MQLGTVETTKHFMTTSTKGRIALDDDDDDVLSSSSSSSSPFSSSYHEVKSRSSTSCSNDLIDDVLEITHCYCPNCGKGNATSKLLPTTIPSFREIIIVSLMCEDCHYRDNEVSFSGEIQPWGSKIVLTVLSRKDLNRQIIKSDSATVLLPNLSDLEIPPTTQRGVLTTIEGMLIRVHDDLASLQPESLKVGDIDNFYRCQSVIDRIQKFIDIQQHKYDHQHAEESNDHDDDNHDDDDDHEEEEEEDVEPIFPFRLVLDDPAGNSYIESHYAPNPDPQIKIVKYDRSPTQDFALGLQPSPGMAIIQPNNIESDDNNTINKNIVNATRTTITSSSSSSITSYFVQSPRQSHDLRTIDREDSEKKEDPREQQLLLGRTRELLKFPTVCTNCHKPVETDMTVTDIPHFKEVILMCLVCDHCGYRSCEVKGGGSIPEYGSKITVTVSCLADLHRDVLKSDTAGIQIPEIDLQLQEGGLNGLYTTIEGLLVKMIDQLKIANPFGFGDSVCKHHLSNDGHVFSTPDSSHVRYMTLLQSLEDMSQGRTLPFTLIITDPLSNSFVSPIPADVVALSNRSIQDGNKNCYDSYVDPGITWKDIERTYEQNELLGLNDLKTEGYSND